MSSARLVCSTFATRSPDSMSAAASRKNLMAPSYSITICRSGSVSALATRPYALTAFAFQDIWFSLRAIVDFAVFQRTLLIGLFCVGLEPLLCWERTRLTGVRGDGDRGTK